MTHYALYEVFVGNIWVDAYAVYLHPHYLSTKCIHTTMNCQAKLFQFIVSMDSPLLLP